MKRTFVALVLAFFSLSAISADPDQFKKEDKGPKTRSYAGCDQVGCDFYSNKETIQITEKNSRLRVSSYSNNPNQVKGLTLRNLANGKDIEFTKSEILGKTTSKTIPIGEYEILPLTNHDISAPHFSAFFIFWGNSKG